MKRRRGGPFWGVAIALLIIAAIAVWQWETLARFAIIATVERLADVRLSFGKMSLASDRAVFEDVLVTSLRNEPIAEIARLYLAYDLRDLLPGGRRRFGLKAVEADAPHLTIIRRTDGSYNVPAAQFQANERNNRRPLIVKAQVRNGSIDIVDQGPLAAPDQRRLYVARIEGTADISTAARSTYAVDMQYGERLNRLFPLHGRGDMDQQHGSVSHRWTAAELPIAAAVNFVLNSPDLRLRSGVLRDVDARYFGLAGASGALDLHLATSATLNEGRITIRGLSKPIDGVHGPVDVYDDGLLSPRLDARVAGVPVQVSGGVYGLRNPRLRIAVRGNGDLTQLRSAFAQAARLPMRGPLLFALLVEGAAAKPLIWIDLRSPRMTYASASLDSLRGLIAFDGREAGVVDFGAHYQRNTLSARGRVALANEPGAIDVLLGVQSPPGALPYVSSVLPRMTLNGVALATASNPKAIAMHGVLYGVSPTQGLDAIFNVDSRGSGAIGPLVVSGGRGSLYARIALDRPHGLSLGLVQAHDFALPSARAALNATFFGAQTASGISLSGKARLTGPWGDAVAHGVLGFRGGGLAGGLSGNVGNDASFGATVAGTPQSPRIGGAFVVAGGRYRDFNVTGNGGLTFANGRLHVHDTAVVFGPLFLAVAGTVENVSPQDASAPRYDLTAQFHSSDVRALLAAVQPPAVPIAGSIDAAVRVHGTGLTPSFAGTISAPEGSINGLAIRNLHGTVRGNPSALSLIGGHVVVGSTALALRGNVTAESTRVTVHAPQSDLSDFNDFFDAGDTFAGVGYLTLAASLSGRNVVATAGDASFVDARFRRIEFGNLRARWGMAGRSVVSTVRFGGPAGEVRVAGTILPSAMRVNLHGTAHAVDLDTWLPMLGFHFPITGRLDAQTNISGRYPDIAMTLHGALNAGTAGHLPIERFEISALASHGRGTIQAATLELPSLTTAASGTFGLRPNDPLALVGRSTSQNVGAFIEDATGKNLHVAGTLDSTWRVDGTRQWPRLHLGITVQSLQYEALTIPRITGEIDADRNSLAVHGAAIDFEHGRALVTAEVPIKITTTGVTPGNGPIAASLSAEGIELSNFLGLLPRGTQMTGRIDGRVIASGTLTAPELNGSLGLQQGSFGGPLLEKTPITGIGADLAFTGTHAQFQSRASVGGGTLAMQGAASIANLQRFDDSTFALQGRSNDVRLDLPGFFRGNLNGEVSIAREYSPVPVIRGNVTVSNARIPPNTLLTQTGDAQSRPRLPNVAFNGVRIIAGNDVRLQSANVDIGATGEVALAGTVEAPTLAGSFQSTGGSLSFYRTFNLESGNVTFRRSNGIIPDLDAVATTFVPVPATAVRLRVTGPATNMNLKMESNPPYSDEQILGLLVGAQNFGAVRGVENTGQSFSAGAVAGNLALGQLNTLFTRNVLQPFSSSLAGALGFNDVQLTTDIQSGVGIRAVRGLGSSVNAIFAQTFGISQTTSFTLEGSPGICSSLRLTLFTSQGPTILSLQHPQPLANNVLNVNPMTSFTPTGGTNGVAFFFVKKLPCVRGIP